MAHRPLPKRGPRPPEYHLCVYCDASYEGNENTCGIGVYFLLVDNNNHQTTDLLYAWSKTEALNSAMAERKAIGWALAIYDINSDLHRRINGITRRLLSAVILNDCKTVADNFKADTTRRFGCAVRVQWESNNEHSATGYIAIVDRMARDASTHLKLNEAVFSVTLLATPWMAHRTFPTPPARPVRYHLRVYCDASYEEEENACGIGVYFSSSMAMISKSPICGTHGEKVRQPVQQWRIGRPYVGRLTFTRSTVVSI